MSNPAITPLITMAKTFEDLKYEDFMALMDRSDREQIISAEHQDIVSMKIDGTFEANKANKNLNRFTHTVCFDHSRVILPTERDWGSYINANYIGGFEHDKKFICGEVMLRFLSYALDGACTNNCHALSKKEKWQR